MIHGYPMDGTMVQGVSEVIHVFFYITINAFVARGILVTGLHCGTPELCLSAIYIVSSVGTSFHSTHQEPHFQYGCRFYITIMVLSL